MNDQPLHDLAQRFAAAELAGDVEAYDDLLHPGFRGIGPVGFVLDRAAWAGRHRGDLTNHELTIEDLEVRRLDASAILIGVQRQRTTAMGRDTSGRFRIGMVAVQVDGRWSIAQVQLSGPMIAPG